MIKMWTVTSRCLNNVVNILYYIKTYIKSENIPFYIVAQKKKNKIFF